MPSWSARQGGTQAWEGRCLAGLAAIVLAAVSVALAALAACPALAAEPESYTYEVTPLLSPFNTYIYVSTENPDPESFRLTDKQSTYASDSSDGGGAFSVVTRTFADVKYEKEATHRVAGGYILSGTGASDGGELVLQKRSGSGYVDTSVKVSCPALVDKVDYLINTYTKDKTGLTNQLDAVQTGLDDLALYPHRLVDDHKAGDLPCAYLGVSPYQDVNWLNKHYEDLYATADKRLLSVWLYPYVLDSQSFPSLMFQVAQRLGYGGTYAAGSDHSKVVISGKEYGGQGSGGRDPFFLSDVKQDFTFQGTGSGSAGGASLTTVGTILRTYASSATAHAASLAATLDETAVAKNVGTGGWLRVRQEGTSQTAYVYVSNKGQPLSNVWVDGRYVNSYHRWEPGATFSQHPQASILLHNQTYTWPNRQAEETGDLVYYYNQAYGGFHTNLTTTTTTISTAEAKSMNLDASTNVVPEKGFIYDGESAPGTPFATTHVTSLSLPGEVTVNVGETTTVVPTFSPAGALSSIRSVEWSDPTIAGASVSQEEGKTVLSLKGISAGTATLTLTTLDGAKTATMQVTVIDPKATDIAEQCIYVKAGKRWNGKPIEPTVQVYSTYVGAYLVQGTDYDVTYANNVGPYQLTGDSSVTITGKGRYHGSTTKTFSIERANLRDASVSLDAIPSQTWTGQPVEPDVTIRVGETVLQRGTDYDLTYSNNVDAGWATVTITGKRVTTGTRTARFHIDKPAESSSGNETSGSDSQQDSGTSQDASQQQGSGQDSSSDGQQGSSSQGSNTSQGSSSQSPQATGGSGQTPSSGSADGTGTSNGGGPSPSQPTDGGTMYRLFNQWSGEHLFTMDAAERDQLVSIGWQDEGAAWGVPTSGDPVYRLYNRYSGDHFYTGSLSEYEQLASIGWSQEGVSFLSGGDTSIYRLFNQWLTQGTHLFTTDKSEYDDLVQRGWQGEGVAFRGIGA